MTFTTTNRPNKDVARSLLIDDIMKHNQDRVAHMLTFPGVEWKFERELVARGQDITVIGLEKNRDDYIEASRNEPDECCKVFHIDFDKVDDISSYGHFDVAWLDFCGTIYPERANQLTRLFANVDRLYVTIIPWTRKITAETKMLLKEYGTPENWLHGVLDWPTIVHRHEYRDTTPMLQIGFAH